MGAGTAPLRVYRNNGSSTNSLPPVNHAPGQAARLSTALAVLGTILTEQDKTTLMGTTNCTG